MMAAGIGSVVSIYMDNRLTLEYGDCIQTETGRTYRIVELRQQTRGKHIGRWHLQVLVIDPAKVTADDRVVPIHWYRR